MNENIEIKRKEHQINDTWVYAFCAGGMVVMLWLSLVYLGGLI